MTTNEIILQAIVDFLKKYPIAQRHKAIRTEDDAYTLFCRWEKEAARRCAEFDKIDNFEQHKIPIIAIIDVVNAAIKCGQEQGGALFTECIADAICLLKLALLRTAREVA